MVCQCGESVVNYLGTIMAAESSHLLLDHEKRLSFSGALVVVNPSNNILPPYIII